MDSQLYSTVISTLALVGTAVIGTVQVLAYRAGRRDKDRERAEREHRVAIATLAHERKGDLGLRVIVTNTGKIPISDGRVFLHLQFPPVEGEPNSPSRSMRFPVLAYETSNAIEPDARAVYDMHEGQVLQVAKLLNEQGARPSIVFQNAERPIETFTGPDLYMAITDVFECDRASQPHAGDGVVATLTVPTRTRRDV